jgi:hypothetical protein
MCDSAPNLRPFQYSPKHLFLMVFWEKGRRDWRPLIFSEVLQSRCCSQALNAESPWVKNATPSQFNVCPCRCFPLREEPRVRIRLPPGASRTNGDRAPAANRAAESCRCRRRPGQGSGHGAITRSFIHRRIWRRAANGAWQQSPNRHGGYWRAPIGSEPAPGSALDPRAA